jgi:hypothetical protein
MRTTVNIDDQLLIEVKTVAARSGRTLSAVIEDAIRAEMARRSDSGRRIPQQLPTVSGGVLQPGVDLDDSAALLELMEGADR